MKQDPAHHVAIAELIIVSGFMLFLIMVGFFLIDSGATGKAVDMSSTAYILPVAPEVCNVTLYSGYNLMSIPCISTAEPMSQVMPNLTGAIIYQYVPGTPTDRDNWKVYNSHLPSYVYHDLQYFNRRAGYIAIMDQDYSYTIDNGTKAAYTNIPIAPGWNLVGYPSKKVINVSTAFSPINASFSIAMTYNNSAGAFVIYTNPGGDMEYVQPGQGYWINGTSGTVWTVYP